MPRTSDGPEGRVAGQPGPDQPSEHVDQSRQCPGPGAEIALAALGRGPDRELLIERLSGVSYADWRVEMLGLAAVET